MLKAKKKKLTIKKICSRLDFYVGRTVTLEGTFRGWGMGECEFPAGAERNAPKTRSDWLISTGHDCAYVTGGLPQVSPTNQEDVGCRIEITGTVALSEDGGVYFEYLKGRRLSAKPLKAAA